MVGTLNRKDGRPWIAYDPWNATHIALRLQDEGATMVEFRQGFRSMAAPTRELEKLIVSRKLAHGGNPVTRWMAANVAVAQDPAGNLKPAKDKSTERIDGIVAAHHGHRPRHGRPGGAPARVLHVLCVKGEDATTSGIRAEAMTGLGPLCLVASACMALQLARRGRASAPTRSVEPSRDAALHSTAPPSGTRMASRTFPIFVRSELMAHGEMAFERLLLLAAHQADEVILGDRPASRNSRLWPCGRLRGSPTLARLPATDPMMTSSSVGATWWEETYAATISDVSFRSLPRSRARSWHVPVERT